MGAGEGATCEHGGEGPGEEVGDARRLLELLGADQPLEGGEVPTLDGRDVEPGEVPQPADEGQGEEPGPCDGR